MKFEVFISYSHQDEWLKNELVQHLSSLRRNGTITDWHDRKIIPGSQLDYEIQSKVETADIFLFLISPSFLQSDYCVEQEYLKAKSRCENGLTQIVPVIVRECDWDVHGLQKFTALPTDAQAVTKGALSKEETHQRDAKWLDVVNGLKAINSEKKKINASATNI